MGISLFLEAFRRHDGSGRLVQSQYPVRRVRLPAKLVSVWNLLLLILIQPVAAQASEYTYTISDFTVTLTGYQSAGGAVVIPDTYSSLPVVAIGTGAFTGNNSLTSVVIPDGVITIGHNAFNQCTNLTSVTIPATMPIVFFLDRALQFCHCAVNHVFGKSALDIRGSTASILALLGRKMRDSKTFAAELEELDSLESFLAKARELEVWEKESVFEVLLEIASDSSAYPYPLYSRAANLLVALDSPCPIPCREAILRIASAHYDCRLKTLPFYLVTHFGKSNVQSTVKDIVDDSEIDEGIRKSVGVIGYWAKALASYLNPGGFFGLHEDS